MKEWGKSGGGFEVVAVLAVFHEPAGGGEVGAEAVGGGPVLGLLGGPALFGEGGDAGRNLDLRGFGFGEVEAEGEDDTVEGGEVAEVGRGC